MNTIAEGREIVHINYADPALPASVRLHRPVIWHDEVSFCAFYGGKGSQGVFASGRNLADALLAWDRKWMDRNAYAHR